MSSAPDIPYAPWVYELVHAVEQHELVHPKGDEVSNCLQSVLRKVPDSVRGYAQGWADGYAAAERTDGAQGDQG